MNFYKAFTHDLRSPIQGGAPVWDGKLPYTLPRVEVDTSKVECGAGWNACRDVATAMCIAGFWPDGWPVRVFAVDEVSELQERHDKVRFATGVITKEVSQQEKEQVIQSLSVAWFGEHAAFMAEQQIAWYRALARPHWNHDAVIAGLETALKQRKLDWHLKCFKSARDVWDTWDTWDALDAWNVRDAWDARDALDAWKTRNTWSGRNAWNALSVSFSSRQGRTTLQHDHLTVGLIDAYTNGMAIALPTGKNELGYAMI